MGQRDAHNDDPAVPPTDAPVIRITAGPHRWVGRLDAHTGRGLSVRFGPAQHPILRLGARVTLHLAEADGTWRPTRASVTGRDDPGDDRLYHFALRSPQAIAHLLPPQAEPAPIPRREHRFHAPKRASWVTVTAMQGPEQGKRVAGSLLDVSTHGLGMILDLIAEDILAESPIITCTFAAPGSAGQRVRAGQIVHRSVVGPRIRYGVSFIGEMVGPDGAFTPEPTDGRPRGSYEPAWDCAHCRTRLMLGRTHTHCPGCGAPRGDQPTYFPPWEMAELNVDHWAWGEERLCPFCAITFSDLAAHCGRCGRALPT